MPPPSSSSTQQQQSQRREIPSYYTWPTIKVLSKPTGKYSRDTDEWLFSFCRQTVNGRITGKGPQCRAVSLRTIFPHELRNMFRTHSSVAPDGKAKYELPPEGQATNMPRVLGGKSEDEAPPKKYWDDGHYLWITKSTTSMVEKLNDMRLELPEQSSNSKRKRLEKAVWTEFNEFVKRGGQGDIVDPSLRGVRFRLGKVLPANSLLLRIPPEIPMKERLDKMFGPLQRITTLMHDKVETGEVKTFLIRLCERTVSKEPYEMAARGLQKLYDQFRGKDKEDE